MSSNNPWEVGSLEAFIVLKCPECNFTTNIETLFQMHALQHPKSEILYKNENVTFKGHLRKEYKEKFLSKIKSQKSIEEKQPKKNEIGYQCSCCNSQFKSEAGVRFHISTIHEGERFSI